MFRDLRGHILGPVFHRARPHHRSRRRPQLVRPRPQAGGRGVGRQPRSRTLEIVCVNFGAILTFCLGTSRPTGWHRNSSSARNSRLCWILRLVLTRLPVSGSVVCSPLFYACCVRFPDNFIVHCFTYSSYRQLSSIINFSTGRRRSGRHSRSLSRQGKRSQSECK